MWGIINWGTYEANIYSDSYYIQRAFDRTFADFDEIFSKQVKGHLEEGKRVKIIAPSFVSSEQRTAIDGLKETLGQKFNPQISEIDSSVAACNQMRWFDDLKGVTLIIIGSMKTNPALKCYPFLVSDETNSTVFVDINIWDNKENAVILGSDHPNIISDFDQILFNGVYRETKAKSMTSIDITTGIAGGVLLAGGAGAAVAGAPFAAGALAIGGIVVGTVEFANECIIKNYGGDNWGWCTFNVGSTAVGGVILEKVAGPVIKKVLAPAFRPFLRSSGIRRGLSFAWGINKKIFLVLEDALANGQLELLGKMISKLSATELDNTIKYVNAWDGNAFNNVDSSLNLVRLYDSGNTNVVVGKTLKKTIRNSAVLREGVHYGPNNGFGWEHIVAEGHNAQIKKMFGLVDNAEAVKDFIAKGLKNGELQADGYTIIWDTIFNHPRKQLNIVMSTDSPGSIQTVWPEDIK